jgi:hypothetical protein
MGEGFVWTAWAFVWRGREENASLQTLRVHREDPAMTVIGIDPGGLSFGWALLEDGKLRRCGWEFDKGRSELAWSLHTWVAELEPRGPSFAIIEVPKVYQQRQWKGNPADLIQVAVTAGMVAQALMQQFVIELVEPHAWKGSRPKDVHCASVLRQLDAQEREHITHCGVAKSRLHNVIDAVGLALWRVKKIGAAVEE